MKRNFDRSLKAVLVHEGGYVDHSKDPGSATNMGITIGTLKAYRGKTVSKTDVRRLTKAEAAAIYKKNYWDKVRGDDLPGGVDYAVFDFAVNSGMGRAIPFLQRVVGVDDDGKIGPITLSAVANADPVAVVTGLCDRRLAWLKRLRTWGTFGKGWSRRVGGVKALGVDMARDGLIQPAEHSHAPKKPPAPIPEPPVPVSRGFWAGLWYALFGR